MEKTFITKLAREIAEHYYQYESRQGLTLHEAYDEFKLELDERMADYINADDLRIDIECYRCEAYINSGLTPQGFRNSQHDACRYCLGGYGWDA